MEIYTGTMGIQIREYLMLSVQNKLKDFMIKEVMFKQSLD